MKRIYSICLFLTLWLCAGFSASAVTITIEWDTPGSIEIRAGSTDATPVELSPGQTSYTYVSEKTWGNLYFFDNGDYFVKDAVLSGATVANKNKTYPRSSTGPFVMVDFNSSCDGATIKVNSVIPERNDKFTINVENGLDFLSAKFESNYELKLQNGSHEYAYNPEIDGKLNIYLNGVNSAYSVTLDGTPVEKNQFFPRYTYINITSGCTLDIRVFEEASEEPQEYTLTIDYADKMDGCISNILNKTTGNFLFPKDFTDNSVSIMQDNNLRVNFDGTDYTISNVYLNDKYVAVSNNSAEFTMPAENSVLRIEGTARVYRTIYFDGTVVNPEGIEYSLTYSGEYSDFPEGTPTPSDSYVGGLVFPAGETETITLPISEKYNKFFFRPKPGYFIRTVYTKPTSGLEEHGGSASISGNIDGTTFYMYAEKLPEAYNFDLKVYGNREYGSVKGANTYSDNWGNPDSFKFAAEPGDREVTFRPGYDTPVTAAFSDSDNNPKIYVDGAAITSTLDKDSNQQIYTLDVYSPGQNEYAPAGAKSQVVIYNSATDTPSTSGASMVLEGDATADFFYSDVYHVATPTGMTVLSGTKFIVKPTSKNAVVTYKNEVQKLDENGEFVFLATGNARNNVVTVSTQEPAYTLTPEDGSSTDNLSKITITFKDVTNVEYNDTPIILSGSEFYLSSTEVSGVTETRTVLFKNPVDEGKYTVTFPAGAFTLDGTPSEEITATYDYYRSWNLNPAPGSVIENFDGIVLSFPRATEVEFVGTPQSFLFAKGQTYAAPAINCVKDETASVPTFILSLAEGVQLPPIGNYNFTIEEGTFLVDGKESAEINASYIVEREAVLDYMIDPNNGVIVYSEYGINFTFIFDETMTVTMPSYNDVTITLDGETVPASAYEMMSEMNMLMFMIWDEAFLKEGTLKVNINAGAFKVGDADSPAVEGEWQVQAPKTYTFEVTPADTAATVNDLSTVFIKFPDAVSAEVFNEYGASLRKTDYSYSQTGKIEILSNTARAASDGVTVAVKFDPAPTTAGNYTFTLREGSIVLDGAQSSPEVSLSYNFDPSTVGIINGIYADENGNVTVYSLDGRVVLDKVPASDARNLQKGIYLINGNKVLVK